MRPAVKALEPGKHSGSFDCAPVCWFVSNVNAWEGAVAALHDAEEADDRISTAFMTYTAHRL